MRQIHFSTLMYAMEECGFKPDTDGPYLELTDFLNVYFKEEKASMIKPTIGRVVWFWEDANTQQQPWAGIVCYIHDDTRVNLVIFDADGNPHPRTSVFLWQGDGDGDEALKPRVRFAEWMPFQKGQAMKTEALEKQLQQSAPTPPQTYGPGTVGGVPTKE